MTSLSRCLAKVLLILFGSAVLPSAAFAASTCGQAKVQLQQYAYQVNYFTNLELSQGIPTRCSGNQMCMNWWFQQLNAWYQQQAYMVNMYFFQIAGQCSSQSVDRSDAPADTEASASDGGIDRRRVEQLPVDDDDKTVAIKIPDAPPAFRSSGR